MNLMNKSQEPKPKLCIERNGRSDCTTIGPVQTLLQGQFSVCDI